MARRFNIPESTFRRRLRGIQNLAISRVNLRKLI
jgi:hypothetical protein